MDATKSDELYKKACDLWEFLRDSYSRDEDEWERGVYMILGDLRRALKHDPAHAAALRMVVEMIGDGLGAYEEAADEAEKLVQLDPANAGSVALRDRMRNRAAKK